jgi:hypothetical protein
MNSASSWLHYMRSRMGLICKPQCRHLSGKLIALGVTRNFAVSKSSLQGSQPIFFLITEKKINLLTPELNPSAQRCLTRFLRDFSS